MLLQLPRMLEHDSQPVKKNGPPSAGHETIAVNVPLSTGSLQ